MNGLAETTPPMWRGLWWLAAPLVVAAAFVALAVTTDSAHWAAIFVHPARTQGGIIVESTQRGAALWRAMLPVAAAAIVVAALALTRLCRGSTAPRAPSALTSGRVRALACLIVVALLIRATRLGESLWYDELATLQQFIAFGPGVIAGNYFDPGNHIAHSLATWCVASTLGAEEVWLRLPALVFSLAAVPAVYGLVIRAMRGAAAPALTTRSVVPPGLPARRAGVPVTTRSVMPPAMIAAALMAVMPVAVLEGVESRGYSMMIFFSMTVTWTLLAAVQDNRPWQWMLYAALLALGAWAHMMTAFVGVGHAAWLMFRGWRAWRERDGLLLLRGVVALSLAAVLILTLYSPVFFDILASRGLYEARTGHEPAVLGPEGLHALMQLGGSWYWWSCLAGLALTVTGAIAGWRDRRARSALVASALGMPLAVAAIIAAGSWMYARFLLFGLPAAALAMALGLDALWRRSRLAALAAGAILAAGFAGDLLVRPSKQPLRDAVEYVAGHRVGDERVGTIGLALPVIDYYGAVFDLQLHDSGPSGADLERLLREQSPEWLIVYYPTSVLANRYELLDGAGFKLSRRFPGWVDWTNGDVLVYRRDGSSPLP